MANLYVATLRSIYAIHQLNHWLCKGDSFYASHLLFQRIYESAQENADLAAEKFIGVLGGDTLTHDLQADLIGKITKKYSSEQDLFKMSVKIEQDFIKLADEAYKCFEEEGKLSLGLDDMLCAISSKREESVYLLNSTIKKDANMDKKLLGELIKSTEIQLKSLRKLAQAASANDPSADAASAGEMAEWIKSGLVAEIMKKLPPVISGVGLKPELLTAEILRKFIDVAGEGKMVYIKAFPGNEPKRKTGITALEKIAKEFCDKNGYGFEFTNTFNGAL